MREVWKISSEEIVKTKPNLSVLALISFIIAFTVARTFTILYPKTVWEISGLHIHHFWYGLVLLAVGGWLGITVENERVNRIAAILFGAGGGLIGDEIGLLLTLSAHAYWADFTYTFIIIFLAFACMAALLVRYNKVIRAEFAQFLRSHASLYISVFFLALSITFILTNDVTLVTISSFIAAIALIIIAAYLIQKIKIKLINRTR
jgi:hypothetical protein